MELPASGMMNSSMSMNATQVLRVIYPEVIVGGKLPRPLRPANYRNVPGKAGGANQVGATVCAAIVIKNE